MQLLKPLDAESKPKGQKYAVADIEATNWINFSAIGLYNGEKYFFFDSLEKFFDEILSYRWKNYCIYFHNGGNYDHNFILQELLRRKIYPKMIEAHGRMIQLTIKRPGKNLLTFRDSFSILSSSLDRLSKNFEVIHAKKTGEINFAGGEQFDINNPRHREYLRFDTLALYEVLTKFFNIPIIKSTGITLTAASLGLKCLRKNFMKRSIVCTTQEVQDFCRKGFSGGRVEVFKQEGFNCDYYDANSLYPTQMRGDLPLECIGEASDVSDYGFHDVTVQSPGLHIPVLGTKQTGKFIFPNGIIRGVFFSEEIEYALMCGYKILEYHHGYRFNKSDELFKDYVNFFYDMRKTAGNNKALNETAKLFMNSGFGKMGQREERKSLTFTPDYKNDVEIWGSPEIFDKFGIYQETSFKRKNFMLVHVAAAITAKGRVHMCRLYHENPTKLIYTDTDSIVTTAKHRTGSELGELKLEYGDIDIKCRLAKGYMIRKRDGSTLIRVKGFPKKYLEKVQFDTFLTQEISFEGEKFAKFKSSIKRNDCLLSLLDDKKELRHSYDKRLLLPNGDTRPWEITKTGEIT